MAGFAIIFGAVMMLGGAIGVIRPMPVLFMPTRIRALMMLVAGVLLLGYGGSLLPPPAAQPATSAAPTARPAAPTPTDPLAVLKSAIDKDILGDVIDVKLNGTRLLVEFTVADNLTAGR